MLVFPSHRRRVAWAGGRVATFVQIAQAKVSLTGDEADGTRHKAALSACGAAGSDDAVPSVKAE